MPERVGKALIGFGKLFAAVTLILVLVALIRTWTLKAHTDDVFRCSNISADFIPLTEVRLENFRRSLRFQTVTKDRQVYDRDQLAQLVKFIIQGDFLRGWGRKELGFERRRVRILCLGERELFGNFCFLFLILNAY